MKLIPVVADVPARTNSPSGCRTMALTMSLGPKVIAIPRPAERSGQGPLGPHTPRQFRSAPAAQPPQAPSPSRGGPQPRESSHAGEASHATGFHGVLCHSGPPTLSPVPRLTPLAWRHHSSRVEDGPGYRASSSPFRTLWSTGFPNTRANVSPSSMDQDGQNVPQPRPQKHVHLAARARSKSTAQRELGLLSCIRMQAANVLSDRVGVVSQCRDVN